MRLAPSLPALAAVLAASLGAREAAASPIVAGLAGPVLGDETGVGGALGARAGLRTPPDRTRFGAFVEGAMLRFAGFGPHSGMSGYHALAAGEWSRGGLTRRVHAFAGLTLDRWVRKGGEHDQAIATTAIGAALGAGASWGPVRLDLEGSVTVAVLARATDSPAVGPQLLLLISVGQP